MKDEEIIVLQAAQERKVLSLLGLSARAGYIASGEFMTEKSVKEGKSFLVIVAGDASDNTKKNFRNICAFYNVPVCFYSDKDTIGHSIGKEYRASLSVNNQGMAAQVLKYFDDMSGK